MKKAVLFCLILLAVPALWAQQKYALVIGNGNYTNIAKLNNPVNDANDMAAALQSLGFTVDKVLNGDLTQMLTAVSNLKRKLGASENSYGFFYYAGHGVQSNGENYLIPANASIQSEAGLRQYAVSVQLILDDLNEAGNVLNIIVLDACRDNPFGWNRSGSRGLTTVSHAYADSIIVYATSTGSVAQDGTGRNGLFTTYLLKNLKTPGLEINEVFRLTMGDVARASDNKQRPAVYNQFPGLAYLGTRPQSSSAPTPNPTPTPTTPSTLPRSTSPHSASSNMVWVEGGTFTMGSPSGETGRYNDEGPQHHVTVKGFYIGKYEVTQEEWVAVMGSNPSCFKGDNLPVENVSWFDAIEYCNKLSIKEGLTPCYHGSGDNITCDWNANGYRLPTEAEWEYAAKGGNKDLITYVNAGSNNVDNIAWYDDNSEDKTHPVGTKAPNSLEIYDMSGNVWEWCWDRYGAYSNGAQTDPRGGSSGSRRVGRGGGWDNSARGVRSANRDRYTPNRRDDFIGFRVVRSQ